MKTQKKKKKVIFLAETDAALWPDCKPKGKKKKRKKDLTFCVGFTGGAITAEKVWFEGG